MSDVVYVGDRASNVEASPLLNTYSRVTIHVNDDTTISVGDDTGRELEFDNPFGTEAMAQSILQRLRGFQYQPHETTEALLNPAAEIGDAVNVSNLYAGIFNRTRQFGRLMKANFSAPCDEEINHEYQFVSPVERKFTREVGTVRASLILTNNMIQSEVARATGAENALSTRVTQTENSITATVSRVNGMERDISEIRQESEEISAEVVKQEGGNRASFGWSLKATEFGLYAGNTKVFWVNSGGAHVKGEITATTGSIGGFNINQNAIYNNISKFRNTSPSTGVYLGKDGIQLGQKFFVDTSGNVTAANLIINGGRISIGGNFTVDQYGNLTANSGTFKGNVSAGNIQYGWQGGVDYGTFNANGLTDGSIGSGKYGWESIGTGAIGNNAVSYGKTSFTGTLDQVGINASNISGLSARVASVEAGYFNSISTNSIAFGDYYFYVSNGYVRAASIY